MAQVGRLAWLPLTPEDHRVLSLAVDVGRLRPQAEVFAALEAKVRAQAGNRFGAVRLSHEEVQSVGPAFKSIVDELKAWSDAPRDSAVRARIEAAYPELLDGRLSPAVLSQRVQAFRVKIGLQKAWTRPQAG